MEQWDSSSAISTPSKLDHRWFVFPRGSSPTLAESMNNVSSISSSGQQAINRNDMLLHKTLSPQSITLSGYLSALPGSNALEI